MHGVLSSALSPTMGFLTRSIPRTVDVTVFTDITCDKCGHVFTSDQFVYDDTVPQLDNALHIRFVGGYGEFIDGLDVAVGRQQRDTFVLCHQCAHQLCEWFNIDPTGWHGHCSWTHDTSSTRDESEPEPV